MDVPVGNLVLLWDHPEGRNKIQDRNKSELYVVVHKGECPNNFWIKPLGSNKNPKEVNRRQIFNVGTMQEGLVDRKEEEEGEKEDQWPAIPQYNLKMKKLKFHLDPVINIIYVLDLNLFPERAKDC